MPDHPAFFANNEGELAMGFETHEAVNNVNARFFQLPRPRDIGNLIEARLDLDQRQNGLAGFCGGDQGFDDGAVTTGAVQRLLDCQHLRVCGGLL